MTDILKGDLFPLDEPLQTAPHPGATIEFEYNNGVRFAMAGVACFVQEDGISGNAHWYQVSQADYDALLAHCRADPRSQLVARPVEFTPMVRFAFLPWSADPFSDPGDDAGVTVITAERLEHG